MIFLFQPQNTANFNRNANRNTSNDYSQPEEVMNYPEGEDSKNSKLSLENFAIADESDIQSISSIEDDVNEREKLLRK